MNVQEAKQAADRILHDPAMFEDEFFDGVQGVAQAYLDALKVLEWIADVDTKLPNAEGCVACLQKARDFLNGTEAKTE